MTPGRPDIDSDEALAQDVAAIGRIEAIPSLLRLICQNTGMGFAAVARVSDETWIACAVHDDIGFGLQPGGRLDVRTTLCHEARAALAPIVIPAASLDLKYRDHPTPRIYGIESYISVPIVRADGSYFGNLCAIDPRPAPPLSEPGALAMFSAFAQLIALQLDSEDQRAEAVAELVLAKATADLREHFVAVLGHDLRNPVSAVSAAAQLLIRRVAEPNGVRLGHRLLRVSQRMTALIDDVLDFARVRLGAGIATRMDVVADLGAALRDVVEELRLANPQHPLIETIDIRLPIRCDVGRIQQLLSNLIGNALSHGAADQPISIEAKALDGTLELAVVNFGTPIPDADLGRLFEPYWRPADSKPGGGLGLGLYICAQIVKAHGGAMRVRSSAEEGTRFTASFPISETT